MLHHRSIFDTIKELLAIKKYLNIVYLIMNLNIQQIIWVKEKDLILNYIIVIGEVVLRDQLMKMLKYFQ